MTSSSNKEASSAISTREIWNLTWPQALMMICQFLIGLTDVVVSGRIGYDVQAVLGILMQCYFLFLVLATALSSGGVAAMSQALGAGLKLRASRYIWLLLCVNLFLCFIIVFSGLFWQELLLDLLSIPPKIRPLADKIWPLFLLIIPANHISIWSSSVFRARKNVLAPLASAFIVCIVNLFADLGFGLGYFGLPAYGVTGIILSSALSVTAGAAFNIYLLFKHKFINRTIFSPLKWQIKAIRYIFKVSIPSCLSQFQWQLGYVVLLTIISTLPFNSDIALAGFTVGARIESMLFLPAFAFSFTGSVLVGHALGKGSRAEARETGLKILRLGVIIMCTLAVGVYFITPFMVGFISKEPSVQLVAKSYVYYNLIATPFTTISLIMGGLFSGAGANLYTFATYGFATWCVRLPLAWYMSHIVWGDASGIFVAMLISQIFQSSVAVCIFLKANWYRFASTAKRFAKE